MTPTPISFFEFRVRDGERAAAFYGRLFDWRLGRTPGVPSFLVDTGRAPGVTLVQMPAPMPLAICPYLQVDDAALVARRAADLGAQVLLAGEDLGDTGILSLLLDPWGNHLALLQGGDQRSAMVEGSGRHPLAWLELAAPLLDDAVAFYSGVCGWAFEHIQGAGGYAWAKAGELGVGLRGGGLDSARDLTLYVAVDDLEDSLTRAERLGAERRAAATPFVVPTALGAAGCQVALFEDPEGHVLGLLAPSP